MKAVILAGGLGTRMGARTRRTPKPMLRIGGRPILEHTVEWAKRSRVREFVMCTSHLAGAISRHFGDGSAMGVSVEYATTREPMSTGGQLKSAERLVGSTFACVYGDSLFGFSLRSVARRHAEARADVTIATAAHEARIPYGVIRTTPGGRVTSWDEKPSLRARINTGCYIMEPSVFELIPPRAKMPMDRVIARAIRQRMRVVAHEARGGFTDVGDAASYELARDRAAGARR